MTNTDIFNYVNFRGDLEALINKYIELKIPAIIMRPVVEEALRAIEQASSSEVSEAFKECKSEERTETQTDNIEEETIRAEISE